MEDWKDYNWNSDNSAYYWNYYDHNCAVYRILSHIQQIYNQVYHKDGKVYEQIHDKHAEKTIISLSDTVT